MIIQQLLTVARNTFTESIRQPIFIVVLLLVCLALMLNLAMSANTMDLNEGDNKLLVDLGLSTILVGGVFLAAFTAAGVLGREIDNKTVLTVISKPIGRPVFIAGKYLGTVAAIALAMVIWSAVFLLTVRHGVMSTASDPYDQPVIAFGVLAGLIAMAVAVWGNYFYGWVFSSTFSRAVAVLLVLAYLLMLVIDKHWQFQPITTEWNRPTIVLSQVLMGLLFIAEAVWLVCAVAVVAATRLKQVMTLVVVIVVGLLGVASDSLFGRFAQMSVYIEIDAEPVLASNWLGVIVARIAYTLVPNIQFFWLADAINEGNAVTAGHVGMVSAYFAVYTLALLLLGTALFQRRETG